MTVVTALLFDLDGTLVDTRDANFFAYRDALRSAGHDFTRSQFDTTWGQDSRDFLPRLFPEMDAEAVAAVRSLKSEAYNQYLDFTTPNTALIEFLKQSTTNQATALVTTAKRDNAESILRQHGIADVFTTKVFGEDLRQSKPDPEAYLTALRRLETNAHAALAFEDSEAGIASASRAGVSVIKVAHFA